MKNIYISPSTQENNLGLSPFTNEEKEMNGITDKLIPLLVNDGRFLVARNSPDMNVNQCAEDSNRFNADIHVSIHSNAGGGVGTEVYAYGPKTDSETLAQCLYNQIAPLSPGKDRGIKYNPAFVEVGDNVEATSCLIELAFHDNQTDATWLAYNHEIIAERLYKGICDYYKYEDYRLPSKIVEPVLRPLGMSIMGTETVTVEQCEQYIHKVNPNAPDIVPYYKKYGELFGIKWGYAVALTVKETNYLTFKRPDGSPSDVRPEQKNYGGIGAVGEGARGAWFDTDEIGVLALFQHLFAYASTKPLPMACVDPRFNLVVRGSCPNWQDLNGHWAVPGVGYGEDICRIYGNIAREQVSVKIDKKAEAIELIEQGLEILKG